MKATVQVRVLAAGLTLACGVVLWLAASLTPDPDGHGTHTQLGLPPCGWVAAFGKPCFSCGMTTAFACAAEGDYSHSFNIHPFGAALAILAAATFWGAGHVALTGSNLAGLAAMAFRPRPLAIVGIAGLASWAYKWITWPT